MKWEWQTFLAINLMIATAANVCWIDLGRRKTGYIKGMTWEQIAVEMNYSYRNTTRLHGYALKSCKIKDVLVCPTQNDL